ncbi:MAG: type II toxin-antitoxin system RelE/ParE family toxin [Patescibacteria group bacterium]
MNVTTSERVEKQLRKITKLKQLILTSRFESLGGDEGRTGEEKLGGYKDLYRIRVGDYRIVYKKYPNEIFVILIGHRREVYRLLEQLLK